MRVINVPQNSAAWLSARVGRITASRMVDVMAKPKRGDKELACRRDYRMELVCERLTGKAAEHYVSRDMDWGSEQEPFARSAYEVLAETMVDEIGFVLHPTMDFAGASPDAMVGEDGMLEIKAPKTATHLEWRLAGVVPEEHEPQMMWGLACTGREWADFVSFDPRLPQGLRFFVKRLMRDEVRIAEMETAVNQFHAEVEFMCMQLGAAEWKPVMPGIEEMVSVGDLSIPKDLSDILDQNELVP